jgi:Asp-tRNA(Asn)/Glu-tRNA(Gln) amidotransferase A subunit family amidase
MVPLAFGTQTTASIIRPASFCGVVGYKPTWGFIGNAGLKPLSPSQDTVGVLARTVAEAAFFAFGIHGARVAMQPDLRPRLAVCHSSQWDALRPEMAEAIERLATRLERAGAIVTRVTLPPDLEALIPLQLRIFAFEARQSLAVERIHHHAQLSERLQQRLHGGDGITATEYLDMRRRAAEGRQSIRALFQNVDALLYPPAQGEANEGLLDSGSAQFGALWSLMGVPCVSVPIATGPAGLPMGVQVIGGYGEDEKVLAVAEVVGRAGSDRR